MEKLEIDYKKLYLQEKEKLVEVMENLSKLEMKIQQISNIQYNETKDSKQKINTNIDDKLLWETIISNNDDLQECQNQIEYLLQEFGTKEPCNRFDVGNVIEFIIADYLKSLNFIITELPNAKRVDLNIEGYGNLSVKYSSTGNITLHNSNSCINKDENMTDLILLTTEKLYLITNNEIKKYNIDITEYLINSGDGLKLKRKLLSLLEKIDYPYITNFFLKVDKKKCKNRLCSKVFYEKFKEEYKNLNK